MRRWFGLREDFWPQLNRLVCQGFPPALLFGTLAHFEPGKTKVIGTGTR